MPKAKHSSHASICLSCQTALQPGAKFCHKCGALAGDQPNAKRLSWKNISPAVLIVAAGFGLFLVVGIYVTDKNAPPGSPQPNMAMSPRKAKNPVNLSTMTPREAADRLYNRVMAAEEKGDISEAEQFAPMALQAYKLVDQPDADASFHIGLINLLLGNLDDVRKQIEILKQDSTEHLLGLALAIDVAKSIGDEKSVSDILTQFAAAYHTEIKREKAEYNAHRGTIEKLKKSASSLKAANMSNQIQNKPTSATQLFDSK